MNIQEAQAFIEKNREWALAPDEADPFQLIWAKFLVANYQQLLSRCQTDSQREVVWKRYEVNLSVVVASILRGER